MATVDDNPPDLDDYKNTQESERLESIAKLHRLEPAWSLNQLFEADLKEEFIIEQVLIENQSKVVAGEFKTLKTTLLIMLALSLCSGKKFLGRFEVFKRKTGSLLFRRVWQTEDSKHHLRCCKTNGC